jgi:hypothetical protein
MSGSILPIVRMDNKNFFIDFKKNNKIKKTKVLHGKISHISFLVFECINNDFDTILEYPIIFFVYEIFSHGRNTQIMNDHLKIKGFHKKFNSYSEIKEYLINI